MGTILSDHCPSGLHAPFGRPGLAARDAQILMTWPFFSLSKSPRLQPIELRMGTRAIKVEAAGNLGIATIWDADILIWLISQMVCARNQGRACSSHIVLSPHQLLRFAQRGTGKASYVRLRNALHRLASTRTTIAGILPAPLSHRHNRPFAWINQWHDQIDRQGRSHGLALDLANLLIDIAAEPRHVLTIDPGYFRLTGGLERWLYRLVRKHGGRQPQGWCFELRHLHGKSGSRSSFKQFAFDIRAITRNQSLPGYVLCLEQGLHEERLRFRPRSPAARFATTTYQLVDKL
ncbi:replication initiator protein A [Blastomonas sp.]|uniref:replication initiator protein A n=1 Tax=Blastomonas sp. TaxID=1909299 RepID=UPI00406A6E35